MNLVEELSDCLKKMGKRIKVSYFLSISISEVINEKIRYKGSAFKI